MARSRTNNYQLSKPGVMDTNNVINRKQAEFFLQSWDNVRAMHGGGLEMNFHNNPGLTDRNEYICSAGYDTEMDTTYFMVTKHNTYTGGVTHVLKTEDRKLVEAWIASLEA